MSAATIFASSVKYIISERITIKSHPHIQHPISNIPAVSNILSILFWNIYIYIFNIILISTIGSMIPESDPFQVWLEYASWFHIPIPPVSKHHYGKMTHLKLIYSWFTHKQMWFSSYVRLPEGITPFGVMIHLKGEAPLAKLTWLTRL